MKGVLFFILLAVGYAANAKDSVAKAYTKHILSKILSKEQRYPDNISKRSIHARNNTGGVLGHPKVETTSGVATGITIGNANVFYEIPYAQPPVGELRFQPPKPIQTPQTINATTNNFVQCYQAYPNCDNPSGCQTQEDCLILNIFTPSTINLTDSSSPPPERLPVMFYIHGGSFKINAANQGRHDGKNLASYTNTVVVVINYRLGPFGFLMHRQEGKDDIKGNQGLKDQQMAMQWVQDNIHMFGGDKNKVTLFGNSAGAQSVMFHTFSEVSKNLFLRSIQQSNPSIYSFYTPTPEVSLRITDRLLGALQCSTEDERECLLNSEPSDIIAQMVYVEELTAIEEDNSLYNEEAFQPVLDEEFTDQPMYLYRDGKWNKDKEMIIGVTTQESEDTQYVFPKNYVYDEHEFFVSNTILFDNETAAKVVEKYKASFPPQDGEDYRKTIGIELSNFYFDCASRLAARYASNSASSSVYFYADEHPILVPRCVNANDGNTTGCYLAIHTAEVRYVMRTVDQLGNVSEVDNSVQNQFNTYWRNFADTGDPSDGNLENFPTWPEYKNTIADNANEPWHHMLMKAPTSEEQFEYKEDICNFWDSINYGIKSDEATTTAPLSTTSHGHRIRYPGLNLALLMSFCLCITAK